MILFIDNYDSFTYNLVQYVGELSVNLQVSRNDKVKISKIKELKPQGIIISPGPGVPEGAGISVEVIERFYKEVPILGVCLGHQAIGYAFGGKIVSAPSIEHGKTSLIEHDGKKIYKGLSNPFIATRYHSLVIDKRSLPDCFALSAALSDGTIMGIRHKEYSHLEGVQFHPESILTKEGKALIKNFINQTK